MHANDNILTGTEAVHSQEIALVERKTPQKMQVMQLQICRV